MLTTFRINKDKENPYVMLHKGLLVNKSLSWKAKGVLTYLLSKPDNWVVRIEDIKAQGKESEYAIRAAVRELIEQGYLLKRIVRDAGKRFSRWEYDVFEHPELNPYSFISKGAISQKLENGSSKHIQQSENKALKKDVRKAGLIWTEDMKPH